MRGVLPRAYKATATATAVPASAVGGVNLNAASQNQMQVRSFSASNNNQSGGTSNNSTSSSTGATPKMHFTPIGRAWAGAQGGGMLMRTAVNLNHKYDALVTPQFHIAQGWLDGDGMIMTSGLTTSRSN